MLDGAASTATSQLGGAGRRVGPLGSPTNSEQYPRSRSCGTGCTGVGPLTTWASVPRQHCPQEPSSLLPAPRLKIVTVSLPREVGRASRMRASLAFGTGETPRPTSGCTRQPSGKPRDSLPRMDSVGNENNLNGLPEYFKAFWFTSKNLEISSLMSRV